MKITFKYQISLDAESFTEVSNFFPRETKTVDLGSNDLCRKEKSVLSVQRSMCLRIQESILLHLPKLFLHALPGAIASAQLFLLKLLPEGVSLKFGSVINAMGLD